MNLWTAAACAALIVLPVRAQADSDDAYRIACPPASVTAIYTAGDTARALATAAARSLPPVNSTGGQRVQRWFGVAPGGNTDDIKKVFVDVFDIRNFVTKYWCPRTQRPGTSDLNIAYVLRNGPERDVLQSLVFRPAGDGEGFKGKHRAA